VRGRAKKSDPVDHAWASSFIIRLEIALKGELLFTIHANDEKKQAEARARCLRTCLQRCSSAAFVAFL